MTFTQVVQTSCTSVYDTVYCGVCSLHLNYDGLIIVLVLLLSYYLTISNILNTAAVSLYNGHRSR